MKASCLGLVSAGSEASLTRLQWLEGASIWSNRLLQLTKTEPEAELFPGYVDKDFSGFFLDSFIILYSVFYLHVFLHNRRGH